MYRDAASGNSLRFYTGKQAFLLMYHPRVGFRVFEENHLK